MSNRTFFGKKILWISSLVLDQALHKTSQIEILKGLSELGHKTSLLGLYSKERFESKDKNIDITAIPMRDISFLTSLMYTVLLFLYLPIHLAVSKVDFVIVEPQGPLFLSLIPVRIFPKPRRPKIVLDIRSTPVDGTQSGAVIFNIGIRMAKKLFDGMTIITPMMRNEVCNQFQIDPQTMGIWPSGVSTTLFNPEKYDKNILRKAFELEGKFVVLYHGSVGANYEQVQGRGIVESIKSIKLLKDQYPDVVLYILGDNRSFKILNKLITDYDINDRVILHDKVAYEEVPKYIAMCDVGLLPFNLPIWRNQCPLKLLEYSAMGKVIIATDIPAHKYILENCKSAVFIASNFPEDIAKAISEVHDNVKKFEEEVECGKTIIEKKYCWRQVANELERYLLKLETCK